MNAALGLLALASANAQDTPKPTWVERGVPVYPEVARGEGDVLCHVRLHVDAAGVYEGIDFLACDEAFRDAARDAAQRSAWNPATGADGPVASTVEVIYKFTGASKPPLDTFATLPHTDVSWKRREVPVYPDAAYGFTGGDVECRVRFFVDDAGQFVNLEFVACPKVFQGAALAAARRSEWYPATVDGKPANAQFVLIYLFKQPSNRRSLGPPRRWCPEAEHLPLASFHQVDASLLTPTVLPDIEGARGCTIYLAIDEQGLPVHAAVPVTGNYAFASLLRSWCDARFLPLEPPTPVFIERPCASAAPATEAADPPPDPTR